MTVTIKTEDGTLKKIESVPDEYNSVVYEGEEYFQCSVWLSKGVDTYFHWTHMDEDGEICNDWFMDVSKIPNYNLWIYAWTMGNYKSIDDVLDEAYREVSRLNKDVFNKWVDANIERFPRLTKYIEGEEE